MFRSVISTLMMMPERAWLYGQRFPYEAIVYGLVLAAIAMVSKLLIAIIAFVVVASGVKAALSL